MKLLSRIVQWWNLRKTVNEQADEIENLSAAVRQLEEQMKKARAQADRAEYNAEQSREYIRSKTEVSADISCYGRIPNSVIIIGRYKNRDYVECFQVEHIDQLVDEMRQAQRFARKRACDAPPQFAAFIDREMKSQ